MRAFVIALIAWSGVVCAFLLFVPGQSGGLLACMHQVGRSVACEAEQEAINQTWWMQHTLPTVIGIAASYVVIVLLLVIRSRRRAATPA